MCAKIMMTKTLVLLLFVGVVVSADEERFLKDAVQFLDECGSKSLSICFKERALTYIDQLPTDIEVGSTFTVKRTDRGKAGRRFASPTLPENPKEREEMLDNILTERIYEYLASHTIEFKIPRNSMGDWKRSFEDAARSKGEGKKDTSLLLLVQLKAAMIGAMALKLIGIVAFKALLVAKIALTIASVIGLRKLLESKHHSTYEVIAHPHYTEEHIHDRAFGQQKAYKGHHHSARSVSL